MKGLEADVGKEPESGECERGFSAARFFRALSLSLSLYFPTYLGRYVGSLRLRDTYTNNRGDI